MSTDHDGVSEPRTWLPDPSHYPEQLTPLSATVWFEALGLGLHEAARTLGAPFGGFRTRTELGWAYEGELPAEWEADPARLEEAALSLADRWTTEYRPRVRAITTELAALRPELPAPEVAAAELDRLWELVREQWTIHFLVVLPAQIAAELFHDRYVELAGGDDPLAPYRLLERPRDDEALQRLARSARARHVDHLIRELTVEHALARLRETIDGRAWLSELSVYLDPLDGAGGRCRLHELSLPREAELPRLTFAALRLALDEVEPPAPAARPAVPAELADLHELCEPAYALKEAHAYDIDYPGLLATREALLGCGRRLVAEGLLDAADDVWMLRREELRRSLIEPLDLRALRDAARAELARGLAAGPRPFLGEPPDDADRHVVFDKFYGSGGRALAGSGASPGIAEGTARVVAGPEDFDRVGAGDVLVATTTTPAWTPLFRSVSALVTDTGGILSHAAIVAREYGIPAIVGASGATSAIPDGARIRVDGTTGEVLLL